MFLKIIIFIIIITILILIYNYFGIIVIEKFINLNTNQNNNLQQLNNRFKNNTINTLQTKNIDKKILFNNKDYNENLSIDNKDGKYFYDDTINQSDINENAFNIVYSIDPIDYGNVKTGIDKCNNECDGICFENGYNGIATCYPIQNQTFDWGTLYKNPTFTYGNNAYGSKNLPQ